MTHQLGFFVKLTLTDTKPMEDTKAQVLKQIEFYFSDTNLVKDKFLRPLVDNDPEGCKVPY